jgi:hypothetical protein
MEKGDSHAILDGAHTFACVTFERASLRSLNIRIINAISIIYVKLFYAWSVSCRNSA